MNPSRRRRIDAVKFSDRFTSIFKIVRIRDKKDISIMHTEIEIVHQQKRTNPSVRLIQMKGTFQSEGQYLNTLNIYQLYRSIYSCTYVCKGRPICGSVGRPTDVRHSGMHKRRNLPWEIKNVQISPLALVEGTECRENEFDLSDTFAAHIENKMSVTSHRILQKLGGDG